MQEKKLGVCFVWVLSTVGLICWGGGGGGIKEGRTSHAVSKLGVPVPNDIRSPIIFKFYEVQ